MGRPQDLRLSPRALARLLDDASWLLDEGARTGARLLFFPPARRGAGRRPARLARRTPVGE